MKAMVVYESVYGNTRAVAEAIAEGLDGADVVAVCDAASRSLDLELLVVGGPTHMHGLSTARSRQLAAAAAQEDPDVAVEQSAMREPGLRAWLHDLPSRDGGCAAAFDTRLDKSPWLTGVAAHGIARRLRGRGYELLGSDSFLVQDSEGPLEQGELDRARHWGEALAHVVSAKSPSGVQG
jgi:flavodoxin-like protein